MKEEKVGYPGVIITNKTKLDSEPQQNNRKTQICEEVMIITREE